MSVSVSETNATYNFYPTWVPSAEDWMDMFGGKADAVNGWLTNPTVLGNMTLANPPSAPSHAATKSYVDGKLSGSTIPDAPSDGTPYCRMNSTWVPAPTTITASVIGDLLVPGNLTVGLNAVIDGNLQLGTTSNGAFKLDVNGPMNVEGSGSFTVDGTTTYLMVTSNALANPPVLSSTALRIVGGDTLFPRISVDSFGGNGQLSFRKANGTAAAPTALPSNTLIGSMNYFGYDGSGYSPSSQASIGGWSDGAWSPTSHPTRFSWFVTPINSLTLGEVMRLTSSGDLLIGGTLTDAGYKLDVNGAARIDSGSGGAFPAGMAGNLIVSGADASQPVIAVGGFGTGVQGTVNFYRAQGTRAAPTGMTGVLGQIVAFGYGATGLSAASRVGIQFVSQEAAAWTDTAQGASIAFRTTPIGTIATVEAMRLQASGNLSIGTTTDVAGYRLNVVGGGTQLAYVPSTQPVLIQGNAALPPGGVISASAFVIVGPDLSAVRTSSYGFGGTGPAPNEWGGFFARGTNAAPVAAQSGDIFARFTGRGYQGAAYSNPAMMQIFATEAFSSTNNGTGLSFSGILNGATAATEFFGARNGSVGIGVQSDWGYRLDVGSLTQNSRVQVTAGATPTGLIISSLTVVQAMPPLPANTALMITSNGIGTPIRQAMVMGNATGVLSFLRTGGPLTAPTATGTQPIGGIEALGYDTTWTTTPNANVNFVSAGTWSATSHPAYTTFGTTPIGSITMAEAGRFSPNGNLLLGTVTDGAIKLDVVGTARISSGIGAFGHAPPTAQPSFTGAKGGNTALASVIAVLVAAGFALDTTTA